MPRSELHVILAILILTTIWALTPSQHGQELHLTCSGLAKGLRVCRLVLLDLCLAQPLPVV